MGLKSPPLPARPKNSVALLLGISNFRKSGAGNIPRSNLLKNLGARSLIYAFNSLKL